MGEYHEEDYCWEESESERKLRNENEKRELQEAFYKWFKDKGL